MQLYLTLCYVCSCILHCVMYVAVSYIVLCMQLYLHCVIMQLYLTLCYVCSCILHCVMYVAVSYIVLCMQLYLTLCYVCSSILHRVMYVALSYIVLCMQLYLTLCYVCSCILHRVMYVALSYIPRRVTKNLSRIIDMQLFLLCAKKNEENIAVLPSSIIYTCIPDPLLCRVGK